MLTAEIYQNGCNHKTDLDVTYNGIVGEVRGNTSELLLLAFRYGLKSVSLIDNLVFLVSLGRLSYFPFVNAVKCLLRYRKTGKFIIPFGSWMFVGCGYRTAFHTLLGLGVEDIYIDGKLGEYWLHKYYVGRWLCIHTKCGGIAYTVDRLQSCNNKLIVPHNELRVYPDGFAPDLKTGPCYTCGEKFNYFKDLRYVRCGCPEHRGLPDNVE